MAGLIKGRKRKAVFFTLDALIAAGILLVGLSILSSTHINRQPTVHLSYISDDIMGVLSELKVSEINNPYVNELISNGNITRTNNTIVEQIGEFWAEDNIELAENFTKAVLGDSIPSTYGYSVLVDNEKIHSRDTGINYSLISSRKVISGYAKLQPILGYTSKTFLTGMQTRKSFSAVYFGGFVGEGNVTAKLFMPQNITNITRAYLEILVGTDSKFYINGNHSGSYPKGSGNGTYIIPSIWEINSSYWSNLKPGENKIEIKFEYINSSFPAEGPKYLGGGYFKAEYTTPDTEELGVTYYGSMANKKHWLTGMHGFINIYSSMYIPGNLSSMKAYLNFDSDYITYFVIGNTTVYEEKTSGPTQVTLTNSQLSSIFAANNISYNDLSMATLPVRIGLKNVTRTSSPLDAALVTDVSGSMDWRMDQDSQVGTVRACNDSNLDSNDTQRLSIAKCAGKDFTNTILNNYGPLVGLVSYESATDSVLWLTDNKTALRNEIDGYSPGGGTCVCCGINDAVQMLINDTQVMFIPRRALGWKYEDSDLSSDPSGWAGLSFNDASWSEGQAALANGYPGANTILSKYEGYYYFRKKFNVINKTDINFASLYVYSDDGADVYLNGNLVDNDIGSKHNANYWNRQISVNTSLLNEGENVVAVKLRNRQDCWWLWCWDRNPGFDLEFAGSSQQLIAGARKKAMIVMTDGEANEECAQQGYSGDMNNDGNFDTAKDDAIKAACDAYANYGIAVYSVGFGLGADANTLQYMSNCTDGSYFSSTNYRELRDTYLIILDELIEFTETQLVNQTDVDETTLYYDSFVEFNYTPETPPPAYGEIPVTGETAKFGNNISQGNLFISDGNTLLDLKATSYSDDKWTDLVTVDNSMGFFDSFNLSSYGNIYRDLGDAFIVNIPVSHAVIGENNTVTVSTAESPENKTDGSPYNKLIYTVRINSLLDYGSVFLKSEGCNWYVEFEDGSNDTMPIPSEYNGTDQCYYANATYESSDAMDDAAYRFFSRLDFDSSGKVEIKLDENNLGIDTVTVSDVPSLWGPAVVEVRVW